MAEMNVKTIVPPGNNSPEAFWSGLQYPTPEAKRIGRVLVPEWMEMFLRKNAGYGTGASDLGMKGEFVEIWRKARKLRRSLWEERSIGDETVREVAMDMVGHLFLLLDHLDAMEVGDDEDDPDEGPEDYV